MKPFIDALLDCVTVTNSLSSFPEIQIAIRNDIVKHITRLEPIRPLSTKSVLRYYAYCGYLAGDNTSHSLASSPRVNLHHTQTALD